MGKWHLGFCRWEFTPTFRGFQSFYGYYTGAETYFGHARAEFLDWRDGRRVDSEDVGSYSTELLTAQAEEIVAAHPPPQPLSLSLPYQVRILVGCKINSSDYQAVHAPLEAPRAEWEKVKQGGTGIPGRDIYRAMLLALDRGVGRVVAALQRAGMWEDTVMLFTTDNGGAVSQAGSNHPLRGTKGTLFEGGVRGAGFLAGGRVPPSSRPARQLIHITDWLPTLLAAAGRSELGTRRDGVDQWSALTTAAPAPRTELVYNLKMLPVQGAVRVGDYKLMFANKFGKDGWYDIDSLAKCWSKCRPKETLNIFRNKIRERQRRLILISGRKIVLKSNIKLDKAGIKEKERKYKAMVNMSGMKVSLKSPVITERVFDVKREDESDDQDEFTGTNRAVMADMEDYTNKRFQKIFDRRWPKLQKEP